ncbi:MAG: preprotein translocase subunit SecY [Gracilibacteraceae bacterium]|nr:preprotein translocase subunit SecY [Gracilibacteraceae bacterium]
MILQTLKDAWAAVSIRKKIIFTLLMLLVFRIGTHIPIPYIDTEYLVGQIGSGGIMDFFNTFSGGSLKRFSVFTLSIMPYITASIIMQLLTVVIPHLERLQKEGEQGRKKIAQYIRYATVVFGFVNGFGITMGFRAAIVVPAGAPDWAVYLLITLVLTAGTAFLMWLGEQITEKGIGNGISLIIFAGIVAGVPDGIKEMLRLYMARSISILMVIAVAVVAVAMVVAVVFIQQGQRKIPVQYTKRVVGRKVYGGQSTHIPLKVNQAGVIPIIFGIALVTLPTTIASWIPNSGFAVFANRYMSLSLNNSMASMGWILFYGVLIVFFTYFYTGITFNPIDVADNIRKNGGFIPGLRPGRPTSEYLLRIMGRITMAGGVFLAIIAVFPSFIVGFTNIDGIYIGGTSLLILVSVALDTMKQLEAQLLERHYQGFLK